MTRRISRRALARQIGLVAGGAAVFGSGAARALPVTPDQVEGPFYPPRPHAETDVDLTRLEGHAESAAGEVILVRGRVTDAEGRPLADARVDIWQADHRGRYTHPDDPNPAPRDPHFQGIGITRSDADGHYGFRTIKPGAYPLGALGSSGWRARHIHFKIADPAGRKLTTQMYFADDPLLADDVVLKAAPAEARHLLITTAEPDEPTGLALHRFDIVLA